MRLYLNKNLVAGFVAVLAFLVCLGVYVYVTIQGVIGSATHLTHASRVVGEAEGLMVSLTAAQIGVRGFVITGDDGHLEQYYKARDEVNDRLKALELHLEANTVQATRVNQLSREIASVLAFAERMVKARRQGFQQAQEMVSSGEGISMMSRIDAIVEEIKAYERAEFSSRNRITDSNLRWFQFAFVVLLVFAIAIVIYLFYRINAHLHHRAVVELKLRTASKEIQELNKELEGYTYSVSHDLRAPLRSIAGYSQVLKEDYAAKLDDEGNRVIDIVIRNAHQMGQLIDDLLHFSRVGRKEVNRFPCDINQMVRSVVNDLGLHRDSRLDLRINNLEPVKADPGMLRQVWTNLLSNAVKYSSKKEKPVIEVGSYRVDGAVCYYVRDNGVGFNMTYKDKLFGVFQRLHKSTEFEGTGVGLALVKRIVTRHGGEIWAEARVNEGATFFFTLPRQN